MPSLLPSCFLSPCSQQSEQGYHPTPLNMENISFRPLTSSMLTKTNAEVLGQQGLLSLYVYLSNPFPLRKGLNNHRQYLYPHSGEIVKNPHRNPVSQVNHI